MTGHKWGNAGKLGVVGLIASILGPLIKAFALQNLWNWFATSAIHGGEISYLQALGIAMVAHVLTKKRDSTEDDRWSKLMIHIEACVPGENKQELRFALKKYEDSYWRSSALPAIEGPVGDLIVLTVGFVIHFVAS